MGLGEMLFLSCRLPVLSAHGSVRNIAKCNSGNHQKVNRHMKDCSFQSLFFFLFLERKNIVRILCALKSQKADAR